jgi:hypothetical protein
MYFSRLQERKEKNPPNYDSFCARERKNTSHITSHITLNQRQRLSFGTVWLVRSVGTGNPPTTVANAKLASQVKN